jgi:predicted aldo/keto reductase-like oxidoreductase
MSKVTTDSAANPRVQIDELRRLANTEYFDVMLMHCQQTATWPTDTIRWQEEILEAKSRRVVLGFGASVHGLPALRKLAESKWAEIAMIRTNHRGTMMDAEGVDPAMCGDVAEVVKCVGRVRSESIGVIGMKLVGEGAFTTRADRQAAMKFAFNDAHVDCVSIGFKSTMEIDEAIENLASAVITARV